MTPVMQAIRFIEHVVQDHGDEHTVLGLYGTGGGMDPAAMEWFGRLLAWSWPPSYVETLGKYNGVIVKNAIVHSFIKSIDYFMSMRESWQPAKYWPVSDDECGNYHVLSLELRDDRGECPVLAIYHDVEQPIKYADNYAQFIVRLMGEQCESVGCNFRTQ